MASTKGRNSTYPELEEPPNPILTQVERDRSNRIIPKPFSFTTREQKKKENLDGARKHHENIRKLPANSSKQRRFTVSEPFSFEDREKRRSARKIQGLRSENSERSHTLSTMAKARQSLKITDFPLEDLPQLKTGGNSPRVQQTSGEYFDPSGWSARVSSSSAVAFSNGITPRKK